LGALDDEVCLAPPLFHTHSNKGYEPLFETVEKLDYAHGKVCWRAGTIRMSPHREYRTTYYHLRGSTHGSASLPSKSSSLTVILKGELLSHILNSGTFQSSKVYKTTV
jgi:hypothetical protein